MTSQNTSSKSEFKHISVLLDECIEALSIKPDGTINSTNTFNLLLKISKTNNDYNFNVSCNEGSLGFASSYKLVGNNLLTN